MTDVTRWEVGLDVFDLWYEKPSDDGDWVRHEDHLAALERVRVETLREVREAVVGSYPCTCNPALPTVALYHAGACNSRWAVPAIAALDRLINAATTGPTQ